jgi:methyl-accepting chemotaxis protein
MPSTPAQHRRKLRNYLLDRHFQLKYAAYMVAVAAVLSAVLGVLLWRTSASLVEQSREVVARGRDAAALGSKVAAESRKVSAVVKMNIVKDPVYADSPELAAAFESEAGKQDALLAEQGKALEAQAGALAQQASDIESQQRTLLRTLIVVLVLLVVAVGLMGIVVTHRVAGPVYKMTRQLGALTEGHLKVPDPLRRGDELGYFFEAFEKMVRALRTQREAELERLERATKNLAERVDGAELVAFEELAVDMKKALDG